MQSHIFVGLSQYNSSQNTRKDTERDSKTAFSPSQNIKTQFLKKKFSIFFRNVVAQCQKQNFKIATLLKSRKHFMKLNGGTLSPNEIHGKPRKKTKIVLKILR